MDRISSEGLANAGKGAIVSGRARARTIQRESKMEKTKLTRSDAAIKLIAFADEKMDLTDQEAAAALTLAACFLAGGNAENILSIIRLVFATADVMRET